MHLFYIFPQVMSIFPKTKRLRLSGAFCIVLYTKLIMNLSGFLVNLTVTYRATLTAGA